jgi:AcrR family transcriptional regulator
MTTDKRAMRTQAWLFESLLDLLKVKNYKDISVTELTEKADIARPTFYRNYNSIDDILIKKMDEVFDEYILMVKNVIRMNPDDTDGNVNEIVRLIFIVWGDNASLFNALLQAELTHKAVERFTEYVNSLQSQVIPEFQNSTITQRYLSQFFAAGTFQFLRIWMEEGRVLTVDEVTEVFDPMMKFLLKTTREYSVKK